MTDLNKKISNIWFIKYRPTSRADFVGTTELKRFLDVQLEIAKNGKMNLNNLLLVGAPGVGKSTIANIIIKELDVDYLYLNASIDNGINIIRNQILKYVRYRSLKNIEKKYDKKVVWLDEADSLTPQFQEALRSLMEKYEKNVRFILTGNSWNFSEALLDRFRGGIWDFDRYLGDMDKKERIDLKKDIYQYALNIIIKEGVKFKSDVLKEAINEYYPSIRSIVSELNKQYLITGDLTKLKNKLVTQKLPKLLLDNDIKGMYEMSRNTSNTKKAFSDILKLLTSGDFTDLKSNSIAKIILTVGKYQYRDNVVVDKKANFFYFLIELSEFF